MRPNRKTIIAELEKAEEQLRNKDVEEAMQGCMTIMMTPLLTDTLTLLKTEEVRESYTGKLTEIIAGMEEEVNEWEGFTDEELSSGVTVNCDWFLQVLNALKGIRARETRLLNIDEVRELKVGALVWLEVSGGYEGTRYQAIPAIISMTDKYGMLFYNSAGRSWDSYNRDVCGWRLWSNEPTDAERLGTKWKRA